jgi:glycosyltransferase involved in cell wall biosynthesis
VSLAVGTFLNYTVVFLVELEMFNTYADINSMLSHCVMPNRGCISVIIPAHNERETLPLVIARVAALDWPSGAPVEIIVIDDGSSDGSAQAACGALKSSNLTFKVLIHAGNFGKGAALAAGIRNASGSIIVTQDADLEYDPDDIFRLVRPVAVGAADVVYGSRFLCNESMKGRPPTFHMTGNKLLTWFSNSMTGLDLTDMETGYKVFRRECVEGMTLRESGFGIEPELTIKLAGRGFHFKEVPVSYTPRTSAAGKKIKWRDGIRALWCILRYGIEAKLGRLGGQRRDDQESVDRRQISTVTGISSALTESTLPKEIES